MSDTLAHIRRLNRFLASQARKSLKKKMNPYNRLSAKESAPPSYNAQDAVTTQDVIQQTLEVFEAGKNRVSRVHGDKTDRLLAECNVVSPEIREAWQAKINMCPVLSEDAREKLRQQCKNPRITQEPPEVREMRLNNLARAWCNAWLMAKLDLVNQDRIIE